VAGDRGTIGAVGVVGAGTMGAGIAQLAIEAGSEVSLHDVDAAAIERGLARIRTGLERRAGRLDLDPESAETWIEGRVARPFSLTLNEVRALPANSAMARSNTSPEPR